MFKGLFNTTLVWAIGFILLMVLLVFLLINRNRGHDDHTANYKLLYDSLQQVNENIQNEIEELKKDTADSNKAIREVKIRNAQLEEQLKSIQAKKIQQKKKYDKVETDINSIADRDSLRRLFAE